MRVKRSRQSGSERYGFGLVDKIKTRKESSNNEEDYHRRWDKA